MTRSGGNFALRLLLDTWLLIITLGYGFVPHQVAADFGFHALTPLLSVVLGVPFAHALFRTLLVHRAWFWLSALVSCAWGIAAAVGYVKTGTLGMEWLDTPALFLPFTLAATKHRRFFAEWLRARVLVVAIYFVILLIAYRVFEVFPPAYLPVIDTDAGEGLHLYYATFIWLAALIVLGEQLKRKTWVGALMLSMLCAGFVLEGHRSMAAGFLVGAIVMLGIQMMIWRKVPVGAYSLVLIVLGLFVCSFVLYSQLLVFDESVVSRASINAFRWAEVDRHAWLGLGLPGSESTIARNYSDVALSRFDARLLTVDSGYLDILIRWGWILGPIYVVCWIVLASLIGARVSRKGAPGVFYPLMAGSVFATFGWSLLTWEHGLIVLFAAFAIDWDTLSGRAHEV